MTPRDKPEVPPTPEQEEQIKNLLKIGYELRLKREERESQPQRRVRPDYSGNVLRDKKREALGGLIFATCGGYRLRNIRLQSPRARMGHNYHSHCLRLLDFFAVSKALGIAKTLLRDCLQHIPHLLHIR